MPLLGAHTSIAGGLFKALLRGKETGCEVIQIFTKNRNQWITKKLSPVEIDLFHKAREETSVNPVAAHDSYLINLASPRDDIFEKSIKAVIDELERAAILGIPYLVMHPGSHLGDGERRGIQRMAEAINRVYDETPEHRVTLLLEITAGQGSNLGYRIEHMAEILELIEDRQRLGVCFDTCHAFAAGYDFRTPRTYRKLFEEFDKVIGLNRLKLFHVNDSRKDIGSRIDRHEHPGAGFIGLQAFSFFLNDPRFAEIPFLLETPKGKNEEGVDHDVVNLGLLKNLCRGIGE